jgi:hypothetical protein
VHEIKQSLFQGEGDTSSSRGAAGHGTAFLHLLAKQNLDVIIKALKRVQTISPPLSHSQIREF